MFRARILNGPVDAIRRGDDRAVIADCNVFTVSKSNCAQGVRGGADDVLPINAVGGGDEPAVGDWTGSTSYSHETPARKNDSEIRMNTGGALDLGPIDAIRRNCHETCRCAAGDINAVAKCDTIKIPVTWVVTHTCPIDAVGGTKNGGALADSDDLPRGRSNAVQNACEM